MQRIDVRPLRPAHAAGCAALLACLADAPVFAGTDAVPAADDGAGLAKKLQNPVAALISVESLRQSRGWTYGLLFNHIVSIGGTSHTSDVNATFSCSRRRDVRFAAADAAVEGGSRR